MVRPLPPVLPETAVGFAWALTLSLSSNEEARAKGGDVTDRMKLIRAGADRAAMADPAKRRDFQYVDGTYTAIESALRSLTTIVQGRDKNFDEVDKLMQTQIEKIEAIDKVSADAQSAVPRIFATGGGFSARFVILSFLGISFSPAVMAALGAIAASVSYAIYQILVVPRLRERTQKVMIDADYRRNIYFRQYVSKCQAALGSLCGDVLGIYRAIYDESYDARFDDPAKIRELVGTVMSGEAVLPKWCKYIHRHYHSDEITPDLWSTCESAEGVEFCPLYQREERERQGHAHLGPNS